MVSPPPCYGGPNIEYFTSTESMHGFEKVRQWLNCFCKKHVQSCPPTKESLSQLLISFMQFQATHLGKNQRNESTNSPPIMRVPMRCFLDFQLGRSLCHIFSILYCYKTNLEAIEMDQQWTKFNVSQKIYEKLIELKCFYLPTAYIRPEISDDQRKRITDILRNRQCEIVDDQNHATHIIYPEIEHSSDDYARPILKEGDNVIVHWYYLPESYDSWIPNKFVLPDDISEEVNLPLNTWRVSADWLFDSVEFNEWMSEEDYQVNKNGKKLVHRHRWTLEDFFNDPNVSDSAPANNERIENRSQSLSSKSKHIVRRHHSTLQYSSNEPQDKPNVSPTNNQTENRSPALSSNLKRKSIQSTGAQSVLKKQRKKVDQGILPKTTCPDCKISITVKSLERHLKEIHGPPIKCDLCEFITRREASLLDHQRRKHSDPMKMGRPKKNQQKRRQRSPFRKESFDRHKSAIDTKLALKLTTEVLEKVGRNLEESNANKQKMEQRLKLLEDHKKQKDFEIRKVKSRVAIIECKQKEEELPNMRDLAGLLNYFNLRKDATKEDINRTINLRLMEINPESTVSKEVFTCITKERREELTMFYNEASGTLLRWIESRTK